MKKKEFNCAQCPFKISDRVCRTEDGKHPQKCPTIEGEELARWTHKKYTDNFEFARQASLQERDGYTNRELGYSHLRPTKPRIEEIFDFIGKMGYRRVGMAFCIGLRQEASIVADLFATREVELISVVCKVGRVSKEILNLSVNDHISLDKHESMCNPILQAELLNKEKTDFNILLGLCVGHDSLFLKYADAPCTVLAVKDRVTGHNPLAAIYTMDSYYRSIKNN